MKRLVVLLAGIGLASAVAAAPTYRVVLLPMPATALQTVGVATNDAGDTVGTFYDGSSYRGVVWPANGGAPRLLEDLSPGDGVDDNAVPNDIDALGQVVGSIAAPGFVVGVAVIWSPTGQATLLGNFEPGSSSGANAISSSGTVVGAVMPQRRGEHAFAWTPGGGLYLLPITLPDAPLRKLAVAFDINAAGTAVGTLSWVDRSNFYYQHAWLQEAGKTPIFIAPQQPGNPISARAINANGLVAGAEGFNPATSFVWSTSGGHVPLGTLPDGSDFGPVDINDASEVIGIWTRTRRNKTDYRTYRWSAADGLLDLASLVDPADPLKAVAERKMFLGKINGNGVITVTLDLSPTAESQSRAALLIPVR